MSEFGQVRRGGYLGLDGVSWEGHFLNRRLMVIGPSPGSGYVEAVVLPDDVRKQGEIVTITLSAWPLVEK